MNTRKESIYCKAQIELLLNELVVKFNNLSDQEKNTIIVYILNYLNYDKYNLDEKLEIISCINPVVDFSLLSKKFSKKIKEQLIFLMLLELDIKKITEKSKYIRYGERLKLWKKY